MKRRLIYIFALLLLAMSCQREDLAVSSDGDALNLAFRVQISDMAEVATKAVDPDGGGIQHIILYC